MPRKPAAASRATCHSMRARPPTSSSGLGRSSVRGRMRSPRPAASSMALKRVPDTVLRALDLVQQPEQRMQGLIALAGAAQVMHHQGHVLEVAVLAVAVAETGEDAQHLDVALHPHPLEI